jgi:hypothetical protein
MPYEKLMAVCTILFVVCFSYTGLAAYVLRWMIDTQKVRLAPAKAFRSISPPLELFTARGRKVWWSRWIVLAVSFIFLFVSIQFSKRAKKEADPDRQRTTRGM